MGLSRKRKRGPINIPNTKSSMCAQFRQPSETVPSKSCNRNHIPSTMEAGMRATCMKKPNGISVTAIAPLDHILRWMDKYLKQGKTKMAMAKELEEQEEANLFNGVK
jgi:hypothetical protein